MAATTQHPIAGHPEKPKVKGSAIPHAPMIVTAVTSTTPPTLNPTRSRSAASRAAAMLPRRVALTSLDGDKSCRGGKTCALNMDASVTVRLRANAASCPKQAACQFPAGPEGRLRISASIGEPPMLAIGWRTPTGAGQTGAGPSSIDRLHAAVKRCTDVWHISEQPGDHRANRGDALAENWCRVRGRWWRSPNRATTPSRRVVSRPSTGWRAALAEADW